MGQIMEFLNTVIISQDGVYGLRIIHLVMFMLIIPFLPNAIRATIEIFKETDND